MESLTLETAFFAHEFKLLPCKWGNQSASIGSIAGVIKQLSRRLGAEKAGARDGPDDITKEDTI
jgi:hypothetical protein